MIDERIRRLQSAELHGHEGENEERLDILNAFYVSDDEMTVVHTEVSEDRKTVLLDWNGEICVTLSQADVEAIVACLSRSLKIMQEGV